MPAASFAAVSQVTAGVLADGNVHGPRTNIQLAFVLLVGLCGMLFVWWLYKGMLKAAREELAWLWTSRDAIDDPRVGERTPAIARAMKRVQALREQRQRLLVLIGAGTGALALVAALLM